MDFKCFSPPEILINISNVNKNQRFQAKKLCLCHSHIYLLTELAFRFLNEYECELF